MTAKETFGERIKRLRVERKGWTQLELGNEVGVTSNSIARFERDEKPPSDRLVTKIAQALGVTREELGEPSARPEAETAIVKLYPAIAPLLRDPEFADAHEDVRTRVMNWPAAGEQMTTREWYAVFSSALELKKEEKINPRKDPDAKPSRARKR